MHGPMTDEQKKRLSLAHMGQKAWNKGRRDLPPRSEEAKRKTSESLKGRIITEEHRRKISEAQKGRKLSKEHKEAVAAARGPKNPLYGTAHYQKVHYWMKQKFGRPSVCDHCTRTDAKKYEWANKSQEYLQDRSDWMRLCTGCHMKYDNRFKTGKELQNG